MSGCGRIRARVPQLWRWRLGGAHSHTSSPVELGVACSVAAGEGRRSGECLVSEGRGQELLTFH